MNLVNVDLVKNSNIAMENKMKLKLAQVWSCQQAMPKLLGRELANTKASYWIGRNAKAIDAEYDILNTSRIKMVKQHGVEDNVTKQWNIPKEKIEEFTTEFNKLLETEIEVNITPISISDIPDAKLSPLDTVAIDFMLKE